MRDLLSDADPEQNEINKRKRTNPLYADVRDDDVDGGIQQKKGGKQGSRKEEIKRGNKRRTCETRGGAGMGVVAAASAAAGTGRLQ